MRVPERSQSPKSPSTVSPSRKVRRIDDSNPSEFDSELKAGMPNMDKAENDPDDEDFEGSENPYSDLFGSEYEQDEEEQSEACDEFEDFPWLKSINFPIKQNSEADSPTIGFCTAKRIDRELIRSSFRRYFVFLLTQAWCSSWNMKCLLKFGCECILEDSLCVL